MRARSLLAGFVLFLTVIHCVAATINVKRRGATGNGKTDDTAAINAAIAASAPGDTIYFPPGTYFVLWKPELQHAIGLLPRRIYTGPKAGPPAKLCGSGGYALAAFAGSGLNIRNLTFDGGGLALTGPVSKVDVENNVFQNIDFGPNPKTEYGNWTSTIAIFIDTSAADSTFSHNIFRNLSAKILNQIADQNLGVTGIFGYGLSNVTMAYNTFDRFNEGIHIFFKDLDGNNVHINHNTFTNGHRIAIELQDSHAGSVEVADNIVSHPLNGWALTFGLSIAAVPDTGSGTSVHGNTVIADTPVAKNCTGSGCYLPYGIEAMGADTRVYGNRIEGNWSHGISIASARDLIAHDNVICGPVMAKNKSFIDYESGPQPGTKLFNNSFSPSCLPAAHR